MSAVAMAKWFADILTGWLRPPKPSDDPTPWRQSVFTALSLLLLYSACHALWSLGLMASYGYAGPVTETQVDSKIAAAIKPLQDKVNSTDQTSKAILRALYLPQVRAKVRERCDTTDAQKRANINRELDRIREEYKNLSGHEFGPDPRCDEV